MTLFLNLLSHFRWNFFSNAEKGRDLSSASNPAIFGSRKVRVLSDNNSEGSNTFPVSNYASSSATAITHASVSKEASYIDILQQNGFQQNTPNLQVKTDMLYTDVYTKIFEFLSSFKQKVLFIKEAHQIQGVALSYSQAIRVASQFCKELSDADITDLIDMAPSYIPHFSRKKVVLRALNPKILTKLVLKTDLLNIEELKALFSKSPQLRRFDLSNEYGKIKPVLFFKNFLQVIKTAPNFHVEAIQELNLSSTRIDEFILKDLLNNCPNIENLDISDCLSIKGESLAKKESLKHLKALNLSSTSITEENLNIILSKCFNLEQLDVSFCEKITGNAFANIQSLKHLKALNLSYTSITEEKLNITLSKCSNLEELDLSDCTSITGVSLADIEGLKKLKALNLHGISITAEGLNYLLLKCRQLEKLNLSYCRRFKDQFLSSIVHLKYLKTLNLGGLRITEKDLNMILSNCFNLEDLDLSHCPLITGNSLASTEILKYLKVLDLSGSSITDEGLRFILLKCPNLENLDVSGCASVTSASLANIESLQYLKVLNLIDVFIALERLQYFEQKYPNLKIYTSLI